MGDVNWSGGAQGAAGGALAGSAFGPVGTVIGGAAGGLLGAFGGGESEEQKANRQRLEAYYNQVQNRQAPQMGPAAQSSYSNFRGNQADLVSRLEALSKGQGPSLAMEHLKQATDRNMSQQAGVANSGRGGPLAAQQAANNMALLGSQATQQSTGARIQEQQMALNQLGLTLHGARGMDEETNRFNTGQKNQNAEANMLARLKAMGMNDEAALQILKQMGGSADGQAAQPSMGERLLAGGAGMYAQYATNKANAAKPKV